MRPGSIISPAVWATRRSSRKPSTLFLQTRFDTSLTHPSPAVDITEEEGVFKVSAEVPGMSEKDIGVSLSGDMLTIKGEKRQEHEEEGGNRYLSERSYGAFQRSFSLPEDVDGERIAASFDKGVLTVTLPRAGKAEPKKIEVRLPPNAVSAGGDLSRLSASAGLESNIGRHRTTRRNTDYPAGLPHELPSFSFAQILRRIRTNFLPDRRGLGIECASWGWKRRTCAMADG